MDNKLITSASGEKDSFILARNSQGLEVRAGVLRLTRYLVVFEVYNPYSILQLSEVLTEFKIVINDRIMYAGRAVISSVVNTGIMLICEATLDDSWLDVDVFSSVTTPNRLREEFSQFVQEWRRSDRIEVAAVLRELPFQRLDECEIEQAAAGDPRPRTLDIGGHLRP